MGFFKKMILSLKKTREAFARKIDSLLSKGELDDEFYDELEEVLISSDVGAQASLSIIESLRMHARKNKLRTSEEVKIALRTIIKQILTEENNELNFEYPCIITVIGVNGVGKTTTIGKLANYFKNLNKNVLLIAGDTFRAAASLQLNEWALKSNVKIVKNAEGSDSGAVVYDGIASAKAKNMDIVIVDTAGRLHTKTNLMEELKKIDKIINREYANAKKYNFIVLDATTGQNALNQINAFDDFVKIDGIILTKLDGTAKGGVIIAIKKEYNLPVVFIGTGEKLDDIEKFDPMDFANNII